MSKQQEEKKSAAEENVQTDALQDADTEQAEQKDSKKQKSEKKKAQRTPDEEAERALNRVKRRKKLKYGALATVITIVFVAIVVVVNVICNVLDSRYNWNIDLTSSGLYEIDPQTAEYLHQLNQDVQITVLADESYYHNNSDLKLIAETLNRFKTESNGHISVEYVDTVQNPQAVSQYSQSYSGTLTMGDIVITCGELVRVAKYAELLQTTQTPDYTTGTYITNTVFAGEQQLISAIMGVTDLNPVRIAVIDLMNGMPIYYISDNNYAEYGCYARMLELLDQNNYIVTEIDLATDEIPAADYDMAILCAPRNDLTEAQVQKLTGFLSNDGAYGKTLIYFGSPYQQQALPNLDAFLEIWGISIDRSLVLDSNAATAQVVTTLQDQATSVPVASMTGDAYNAGMTDSRLPIVAPWFRPVNTLFETNAGRTTTPLLVTANTCILVPFDKDVDISEDQAAYNLAVKAQTAFSASNENVSSQMIVFGSSFFLDYAVAGNAGVYDNANYFISLLNTISGKENIITVAEKSLNPTMITITAAQVALIRNIVVFLIPLVVAVIGIVVYVRRKNK